MVAASQNSTSSNDDARSSRIHFRSSEVRPLFDCRNTFLREDSFTQIKNSHVRRPFFHSYNGKEPREYIQGSRANLDITTPDPIPAAEQLALDLQKDTLSWMLTSPGGVSSEQG
jgi:hypothetical protein